MNQVQELKKEKGSPIIYRKDLDQEEERKKLQRQSLLTIF